MRCSNGEEGWGRAEIAETNTAETEFSNVMVAMDNETPPPEILSIKGEGVIGALLLSTAIIWLDPAQSMLKSLSFKLDKPVAHLLVCAISPCEFDLELPSGRKRRFKANKDSAVIAISDVNSGHYVFIF